MESRLVLIIEDDDQTADLLATAIRQADYEVVMSPMASAGLDIAIEIKPDCIVCDVDLPDQDGFWVARAIRTHHSPVSVTPFLFLSAYDDAQSRLQGFQVGADVYMTKPFRVDEVVAQVDALVQMAARLRQRRDSVLSIAPSADYGSTAIEGDLRQMSIATVLSILGMERRTGVFEVVSKKRRAQIEIVGGYVVFGTVGGTRVHALNAMRVMLSWKVGRFSFTPLPPTEVPSGLRTVQAILLDAAKAEDEAAAQSPAHPIEGKIVASSLGGPPSRPDDTGPPSSRAMRESNSSAGPISIAFDLIPSRRPEEMPAAEVAAAVEPSIAAYERGQARPLTPSPPGRPAAAAPKPAPKNAGGSPTRPSAKVTKPVSSRRGRPVDSSKITPRVPQMAMDLDEVFGHEVESISVDIDEIPLESEEGERMLLEEQTPKAPAVDFNLSRMLTPPAGTPLPNLRRTPAIMPPPVTDAASLKPLPAPPAAPRPLNIPRPPPRPAITVTVPDKQRTKKG